MTAIGGLRSEGTSEYQELTDLAAAAKGIIPADLNDGRRESPTTLPAAISCSARRLHVRSFGDGHRSTGGYGLGADPDALALLRFYPLPHNSNIAKLSEALGAPVKRLGFIGSSRKDLRALPEKVRRVFGRLLLDVQFGETPQSARAFGEGVSGVMKLIEDYDGKTFRAAYTVEFEHAVFVLHVFQKKARRGIATPLREIELVRARLRQARRVYRATFEAHESPAPEDNPGK